VAHRSLLSIRDLSPADIDFIFERAKWFLPQVAPQAGVLAASSAGAVSALSPGELKLATLRGVSTLLLFYEASTRTRVSFELAGKLLGSDTINVSAKGSSVEKGESLRDTAMTLAALGFGVTVLRHESADSAALFARYYPFSVINAGAGRGEHPSQALLDAFTLARHGLLKPGVRLAVVGDIANSRVMRSGAELFARYGLQLTLVAPPSLLPVDWAGSALPPGMEYCPDLDSVLPQVDAVMMLRMQRERMGSAQTTGLDEYSKLYGLGKRRLGLLRPAALILHPGPVNRGVEVGEDVFSDPRCCINEQVACGLAVRCAILCWASGRDVE